MKAINITEKEVQAAFNAAKSEETKQILAALFGPEEKKAKPSLDNYKTIKSYEDACEALDLNPILSEDRNKVLCAEFPGHYDFRQHMPKHIIALMKLETISRALWGVNGSLSQMPIVHSGSTIRILPYGLRMSLSLTALMKNRRVPSYLLMRVMARMRVSVLCTRLVALRVRLRTLGSACVRRLRKRLHISDNSSLSFGLNT